MTERIASKRRRIMREFAITEISCVDSPAQVFARATLMKRDDTTDEQQETEPMHKIISRADAAPLSFTTLEDAMRFLKANGMSASDAMSAAAREHPDLLDKYQREGERQVQKAADLTIMRVPPSVLAFESLIRDIKTRDGCDSVTALRRARAENPAAFAEYQMS